MGFINRLDTLLKFLEQRDIITKSGFTIGWDKNLDAPGFVVQVTNSIAQTTRTELHQINSDTVWMNLINHARNLSQQDILIMSANYVLNEHIRNK